MEGRYSGSENDRRSPACGRRPDPVDPPRFKTVGGALKFAYNAEAHDDPTSLPFIRVRVDNAPHGNPVHDRAFDASAIRSVVQLGIDGWRMAPIQRMVIEAQYRRPFTFKLARRKAEDILWVSWYLWERYGGASQSIDRWFVADCTLEWADRLDMTDFKRAPIRTVHGVRRPDVHAPHFVDLDRWVTRLDVSLGNLQRWKNGNPQRRKRGVIGDLNDLMFTAIHDHLQPMLIERGIVKKPSKLT